MAEIDINGTTDGDEFEERKEERGDHALTVVDRAFDCQYRVVDMDANKEEHTDVWVNVHRTDHLHVRVWPNGEWTLLSFDAESPVAGISIDGNA